MRTITLLVIHCSAVRPDQNSSAAQIDTWHRQRGFHLGIGYHYVVRRNGQIEPGRPEFMIGAHCLNHNAHSIGICYEGGLDIRGQPADTRTPEQKAALRWLLRQLHRAYPRALIVVTVRPQIRMAASIVNRFFFISTFFRMKFIKHTD